MGGGGSAQAPVLNADQISRDQTKSNVSTAVSTARLNNVNQVTPFGNLTYNETGGTTDKDGNLIPQFTATQGLSPQVQALVNQGLSATGIDFNLYGEGQNLTRTGQGLTREAQNLASRGQDFSNRAMNFAIPGIQNAGALANTPMKDQTQFRDDAYKALMSRGGAELDRQEAGARARLANQGVATGSVASDRDLDTIYRGRNDLTNSSFLNATNLAGQNQAQDINSRNQVFSELGQLMSFANIPGMVQNAPGTPGMPGAPSPSFVPTNQTQIQATDTTSPQLMAFDAMNKNYQQQQAQAAQSQNALMGGLFGLAGAGIGAVGRRPSMFGLG